MDENEEIHRKEEIERIGAEAHPIKTEREKCIDMYEEQRLAAAEQMHKQDKQPLTQHVVEPVLDTQGRPYDKEIVKEPPYGIKGLNRECPYPIHVGEVKGSECVEGQYESGTYTVKYPDTPEQKLRKYYDQVLAQHEKSCIEAAKYKETHECLPGTAFKATDDPKLSDKILVSDMEKPSPEKYNPCKKQVRFAEPLEKCAQEKDDPCNLKIEKDHCDCTYYNK